MKISEEKIPLSTIVIVLIQIVAMVAFATNLQADIDKTEVEVVRHDARLNAIESTMNSQEVTLARMDENLKHIRLSLDKISAK
tara:strand:- start:17085 stop:17333 length:249 start_codon:yes stop_codon:yes gene_type:complete